MNKVDLILETILFTKNKFLGVLAAFLEDCLSRYFYIQVELNNLPSAVIFNDNNVLREEITRRNRGKCSLLGGGKTKSKYTKSKRRNRKYSKRK